MYNREISDDTAQTIAQNWITQLQTAIDAGGNGQLDHLFASESHWRDILLFSWHIQTIPGREQIISALKDMVVNIQPRITCESSRTPPRYLTRAGVNCIEILISLESRLAIGDGVVRLVCEEKKGKVFWVCWTLSTSMRELKIHANVRAKTSENANTDKLRAFGGKNWLDLRNEDRAYEDRDPAVLVVGGGQAGLNIAARLTHMGVDTLIIDRQQRIGDNWRKRYHSLTLHNEVFVNHMAHMPFPETWPTFIPKDMLANWFEHYVEALELNFWTQTTLISGHYDDREKVWQLKLTCADGNIRIMRPRHVVMATGVSAIPIMPDIPGLDNFGGTLIHSGSYSQGHQWRGKKAFVLGTGNSGHDVAQDLHSAGAEVTIIQRASTHIVSLSEAQRVYAIYKEGIPIEDCDLLASSFPFPVLRESYRLATEYSRKIDRKLHQSLENVGFKLNNGIDECGFQMNYLQRGGGYYFNVGCSDLIASGEISLLQFDRINQIDEKGIKLVDGHHLPADLIVAATGYKNLQETVRSFLGDEIAERVGPIWGFNKQGELRNMWQRTTQPGLWFTAGSLAQCRIFSHFLALQIKACEEGILD